MSIVFCRARQVLCSSDGLCMISLCSQHTKYITEEESSDEYFVHTILILPLNDSSLLLVSSPSVKCLVLKQRTHSHLMGDQLRLKYSNAARMFISSNKETCSSNGSSQREVAISLNRARRPSRWPDRIPIFSMISRSSSVCGRDTSQAAMPVECLVFPGFHLAINESVDCVAGYSMLMIS